MNILLVGCGKMGSAMLSRWQALGLYKDICVVDPASISSLAVPGIQSCADMGTFKPDVIVFAVKPQTLGDIIADYKKHSDNGVLVLSIAAGKPIGFFEDHLGKSAKIIRSMPNTPAAIGQGISVACANSNVNAAEKEIAEKLLGAVGEVLWVDDERLLNPVTALSGSGPAYVFLLIETLTKAGVSIGLAPDMAEKLARQTVIGSAALARESAGEPASQLRENVTSPGGTTAAALSVLMADKGMQDLFDRALAAATKRAEELAG